MSLGHASWATHAERGNMLMLRLMIWISLRLGRPGGRLVLRGIALYFLLFAGRARRASRLYLRRVLRRPVSWRDIFRHLFTFAATVHDRVYLLNGRFDLFDIRLHGQEVIEACHGEGRGALLMGAHLGSFEVLRAAGRARALRCLMLMYETNAARLNNILGAINPAAARDVIALGRPESILRVGEELAAGAAVGILADRSIHQDQSRRLGFLGADAPWPAGPFRIAALLRARVIFAAGLYRGGNRYDVHFELLADFSATSRADRRSAIDGAVARYARLVERYCQEAPYNWFNFYDFWQAEAKAEAAKPAAAYATGATRAA